MPWKIGLAAIRGPPVRSRPGGMLKLGFFGGEPLLEAATIARWIDVARDHGRRRNRPVLGHDHQWHGRLGCGLKTDDAARSGIVRQPRRPAGGPRSPSPPRHQPTARQVADTLVRLLGRAQSAGRDGGAARFPRPCCPPESTGSGSRACGGSIRRWTSGRRGTARGLSRSKPA